MRATRALVGRDRELDVLRASLAGARRGCAGMVVITGAGRTALLDAAVDLADDTVLRATCVPADADRPFHAVSSLLGAESEGQGPVSHRLLARMADHGPVVLALDDAQWCDEASLAWLDMVVRRGLPVLVLLTRRRTADGSAAFGAVAANSTTLDLAPLSEKDIGVLAARTLGAPPHPLFLTACAQSSRGVPAVVVRLLDRLAGLRPVAENAPAAAAAGRGTFAEDVVATLRREPAHVRSVLEAVAVLGSVAPEAVGLLSGVPDRHAGRVLDQLADAGVVGPDGVPERVRDLLLADLSTARLDDLRRSAARVCDVEGAPPLTVAAHLVELSELDETWMRPVLRAAAAASVHLGQPVDALRFLRRLLADEPRDVELACEFAAIAVEHEPAAAYEVLWNCLARTADSRDRTRLRERLERVAAALGRPDGGGERSPAVEVHPEAAAGAWGAALWDPGDEREILAVRAIALAMTGDPEASRTARRALDGPPASGWALAAAAYVLSFTDDPDEASVHLAAALRSGPWSRAFALALRSFVRIAAGDLGGAAADASTAIGERAGADPVAMARVALALVHARRGDADGAEALLDEVMSVPPLAHPHLLVTRAEVAELRGCVDEALTLLAECAALPGAVLVPWWLDAACLHGPGDEARDLVAVGRDLAHRWATPTFRGLAALATGVAEDDRAALAAAAATLDTAPWYLARARLLLAGAHLRAGDRVAARKEFRAAADVSTTHGFRALGTRAREGLLAAGGRVHARAAGVLTDGERRVAELAAAGVSNREIAETLLIALRTVEIHLTSVYRKLGVTGRTELSGALAGG